MSENNTPLQQVLVCDDDAGIRAALHLLFTRFGYGVVQATTAQEVVQRIREFTPACVLLDMNFTATTTGEDGIELLQKIRLLRPDTPVILMTAWTTIELAVEGMRLGAFDFVSKPWDNRHLLEQVRTAITLSQPGDSVVDEAEGANREEPKGGVRTGAHANPAGIVGTSSALHSVLDSVRRVAPTDAPVLILGESGTGKEKIAEALHELSKRAGQPFVKVNLGGVSQSLFESEMFGHRKGAFTDAYQDRKGRFALAEGGTIFLDEIGELDLASQVKLLRVLQDRQYEVLGESKPRYADVRVVCATNANLGEMVAAKTFREDLYYRINLMTLHLPPLRERVEDIEALSLHFIRHFCDGNSLPSASLSPDALRLLEQQPFPGNIRELKNTVERAVLLCRDGMVDLPAVQASLAQGGGIPSPTPSGKTLEALEEHAIRCTMERLNGNISRVAAELGISRSALYRKIEKYGIG